MLVAVDAIATAVAAIAALGAVFFAWQSLRASRDNLRENREAAHYLRDAITAQRLLAELAKAEREVELSQAAIRSLGLLVVARRGGAAELGEARVQFSTALLALELPLDRLPRSSEAGQAASSPPDGSKAALEELYAELLRRQSWVREVDSRFIGLVESNVNDANGESAPQRILHFWQRTPE